ncbi:MAG: PAS domain S-box protein [Anaerolineae bacterium]|nr:PAS domain S-box protein [Anaerolineae bacterium]
MIPILPLYFPMPMIPSCCLTPSPGSVLAANPATTSQLGYPAEALVNHPVGALFAEEQQARLLEYIANAPTDGTSSWHGQVLAASGARRQAEMSLVRVPHSSGSHLLLTLHDLEEVSRVLEALHQAETRYQMVAEFTFGWDYWEAPDGSLLYVSPACEAITGYTAAEMMVHPGLNAELVLPEDRDLWEQHRQQIALHRPCDGNQPDPRSLTFRIVDRQGNLHWIEHFCRAVYLNGQFVGHRASNFDITERKRAELTERETHALAARLNRTTHELFKPFSDFDDLSLVGQQVVEAVIDAFGVVDCGLMLIEPETRLVKRVARAGSYQVQTTALLQVDGPGLVPAAIRSGTLIYAPDVREHPLYAANATHTRSELVIPLWSREGVLGVLDLQSTRLDAFSERDQRLLVAFAERVAAIMASLRALEAVRRINAELEQRVEERTASLERLTARMEAILQSSSSGIVLVSLEGNIVQTNPAFDQLLGLAPDEGYGHSLLEFAAPEAAATPAWRAGCAGRCAAGCTGHRAL